jgi:hypothetical protein
MLRSLLTIAFILTTRTALATPLSNAANAEGFRNVLLWEKTATPVSYESLKNRVLKGACFGPQKPFDNPIAYLLTASRLRDQQSGPAFTWTERKTFILGFDSNDDTDSAATVRRGLSNEEIWNVRQHQVNDVHETAILEDEDTNGEVRMNGAYVVFVARRKKDFDCSEAADKKKCLKLVGEYNLKRGTASMACYFYKELTE